MFYLFILPSATLPIALFAIECCANWWQWITNYVKRNFYTLILDIGYQELSARLPVGTEEGGKLLSQEGGMWNGVWTRDLSDMKNGSYPLQRGVSLYFVYRHRRPFLFLSDSFTVISTLFARNPSVATVFAAWDGLLWWSQLFCKRSTSGRKELLECSQVRSRGVWQIQRSVFTGRLAVISRSPTVLRQRNLRLALFNFSVGGLRLTFATKLHRLHQHNHHHHHHHHQDVQL